MHVYQEALRKVLSEGEERGDRTGTGTISLFGDLQMSFDLREGFPLLTTKKVSFRNVLLELLWFLSGDTRVSSLVRNGVNIWTPDWKRHMGGRRGHSEEEMDQLLVKMGALGETDGRNTGWVPGILDMQDELPAIYGKQWRNFGAGMDGGVDQIKALLKGLQEDPFGRRHIVSAWNPVELPEMALPPCHTMFQFYVHVDGGLSCKMYQRSADMFLGVPYNIASYALLTHMVARHVGLTPRKLFITFGDAHLYRTHEAQAKVLLSRSPATLPTLSFREGAPSDLLLMRREDILLDGYSPLPAISAPLEVGR